MLNLIEQKTVLWEAVRKMQRELQTEYEAVYNKTHKSKIDAVYHEFRAMADERLMPLYQQIAQIEQQMVERSRTCEPKVDLVHGHRPVHSFGGFRSLGNSRRRYCMFVAEEWAARWQEEFPHLEFAVQWDKFDAVVTANTNEEGKEIILHRLLTIEGWAERAEKQGINLKVLLEAGFPAPAF